MSFAIASDILHVLARWCSVTISERRRRGFETERSQPTEGTDIVPAAVTLPSQLRERVRCEIQRTVRTSPADLVEHAAINLSPSFPKYPFCELNVSRSSVTSHRRHHHYRHHHRHNLHHEQKRQPREICLSTTLDRVISVIERTIFLAWHLNFLFLIF